MHKGVRRDPSAGVELPMKLMIALLIIAITIGIVYEGMESYSRGQSMNIARSLMSDITHAAEQVARGGHMTTLVVNVDLDPSKVSKLEWFRIGTGQENKRVAFKIEGRDVPEQSLQAPLPFKLKNGEHYEDIPLELGKGRCVLFLRHIHSSVEGTEDFIAVWTE